MRRVLGFSIAKPWHWFLFAFTRAHYTPGLRWLLHLGPVYVWCFDNPVDANAAKNRTLKPNPEA